MKFVIIGAGAIGGYYGARLQEAGHEVIFIARGAHLEALQNNGLEVVHPDWHFHQPVIALELGDFTTKYKASDIDALFLCTKAIATAEIALALRFWIRQTSLALVSLQNGVDNEAILEKNLENAWIIGGIARRIGGGIVAPGKIDVQGVAEVLLGAWPDHRATPKEYHAGVQSLVDTLNAAHIPTTMTDNIREELWRKLIINNGVNPLTALTGLDTGALLQNPDLAALVKKMMSETVTASRAEGLQLTSKDAKEMFELISTFDAIKSSMQIDVELGRAPEIDAITGPVIAGAKELGISAPITEAISALLKQKIKTSG